jgi:hypothetical protein
LLRILCVFLGASLLSLSVFFCFVFCNKWLDHIMFVLERDMLRFHCQEHSSFHSYRSTSVLFFYYCVWLSFFALIFSDIFISLCQGAFRPLIYVGFHQKSCFKKVRMVLEKRKSFMPIVVQMGACLDCGLDFCMSCLMLF